MQFKLRWIVLLAVWALLLMPIRAQESTVTITPIAHNLNNPRGVAIMPDGALLVVEAGIGDDVPGKAVGTGQILLMRDFDQDGAYDSRGERLAVLTNIPSYNALDLFRARHDEPFGGGDLVVLADGRILYGLDDPFAEEAINDGLEGLYYGDTGIYEVDMVAKTAAVVLERIATLNSFVYDPQRDLFFVTESGHNRIASFALDGSGEAEVVLEIDDLPNGQQPVPSGIAFDPSTGDLLIALLSGFYHDYYGDEISFLPGDAKVLRFDPDTGEAIDAATGLTTAIDVAVDESGNFFVVELTTQWPTAFMPREFDLYNPEEPPDPGGYMRYSGRVTLYPAAGGDPVVLADGLDTPTNITYANDSLYVSTGLGTPGRMVLTPHGIVPIEGIIYRITGF